MMPGLGRLVRHDPRSRNFPAPTGATVKSIRHTYYGPTLNQGQLGACTGFEMSHWLNSKPAHDRREKYLRETDAVALYERATQIDPWPGVYPPEDTGSSGIAASQAAKEKGLIKSYSWAFGFDHMLGALQLGPVGFGTWWYESMYRTDVRGYVEISGDRVGGHQYLVNGVNMRDKYLWGLNSWGNWGLRGTGRFKIPFTVAKRLLGEDGDVVTRAAADPIG